MAEESETAAPEAETTDANATLLGGGEAKTETKADEAPKDGAPAKETEGEKPKDDAEKDAEKDDKGADGDADDQPKEFEPFTLPEGMTMDEEGLTAFSGQAQELGLNQEQAQGLVSLFAERMQAAQEGFAKAQKELFSETLATWEKDSKADKEFGGENLKESLAGAKRALERFGVVEVKDPKTQEVTITYPIKDLMDETGLGSHPEVVRLLHRVGQAIADDKHIMPGAGGGTPSDPEGQARQFFNNTDFK